jgi:hypothetical protein
VPLTTSQTTIAECRNDTGVKMRIRNVFIRAKAFRQRHTSSAENEVFFTDINRTVTETVVRQNQQTQAKK